VNMVASLEEKVKCLTVPVRGPAGYNGRKA
jgi:hypothetical protein